MTIETATRPEMIHDIKLYELLVARGRAAEKAAARAFDLRRFAATVTEPGFTLHYVGRGRNAQLDLHTKDDNGYRRQAYTHEARHWVERMAAGESFTDAPGYNRYRPNQLAEDAAERLAKLDEAEAARDAAADATLVHEVDYTGWTRYMLVTSSAGHVHRNMHCSTCRPTTTFAPVVELSGLDATEAIEMLGETLCTVCYPDAPVARKLSKITKAQAKKLLAAGAEKVAEADEKAAQEARDAAAAQWEAMQSPELDEALRTYQADKSPETYKAMMDLADGDWSAPRRARELGIW